ncbi:sensor histidine kinase [Roseivivax sp.]
MGARIIAFLSIALIPIGLVAYVQTTELDSETRARTQLNLTDITEAAVEAERAMLTRSFGAAEALGAITRVSISDEATCEASLREYQRLAGHVSFVGFLGIDGRVFCSTANQPFDVSQYPGALEALGRPTPEVLRFDHAPVSGEPVVTVYYPVLRAGQHVGHIIISTPVRVLREIDTLSDDSEAGYVDAILMNAEGEVLKSASPFARLPDIMPADLDLETLTAGEEYSFLARSGSGQDYIYAIVNIVPDLAYAMSVWPTDSPKVNALQAGAYTKALPLLMWAASVIVAYLAVNRLVIRHIRTLRYQMRSFARDRRLPAQSSGQDMALELRDMENDFLQMSDSILQDEAQLENALREKTILLKEVHHRVKNNLQLISSIMNMQIRQSETQETKRVLRRLQERIRGLAAIHRQLYRTADLGHVDVKELLEELVGQIALINDRDRDGIVIVKDLDPVEIYPDQAMPLSLLTAEALANAEKYIQADSSGHREIAVRLKRSEDRGVLLEVENTSNPEKLPEVDPMGGLGLRLIQAFSTQLGGTLEHGMDGERFRISVRFHMSDFKPEVVDY